MRYTRTRAAALLSLAMSAMAANAGPAQVLPKRPRRKIVMVDDEKQAEVLLWNRQVEERKAAKKAAKLKRRLEETK